MAEAISDALADYFVVDRKSMETKLLSDAGIKLHNTKLQPQDDLAVNPTTRASIRGDVQYVAFQWRWGKSQTEGGSDWVKDARLSISGLRFTITLSKTIAGEPSSPQGMVTTNSSAKTNSKKEATGFMAYVQDQVQRIIDTLTLTVDNVLFTVVLPDGSSVQFGGSGLEIQSLVRSSSPTEDAESSPPATSNTFLQKFCIHQLYALVVGKDGEQHPVVDDIFYEAHIQRSAGNRFISGLERGLRVEGDSDNNGVIIHAGPTQLEIMNALLGMLVVERTSSTTVPGDVDTSPLQKPAPVDDDDDSVPIQQAEGEPSFMGLKLSGVSLVLPNDVKLSLADLILKYQFDGTLLRVEGKAGFSVDGCPFLELGETSQWSADLVQRKFRIDDTALLSTEGRGSDKEVVAFLHARQSDIQKVSDGVNQAWGIYQKLTATEGAVSNLAQKSTDTTSAETDENKSATSTTPSDACWSMELCGELGCVVEQETDSEIVLTVRNIKADTERMTIEIESIDECQIPGLLNLGEPIVDTIIQFQGGALEVVVQDVVVVLAKEIEEEDDTNSSSKSPSITVPFGLTLGVNKFLAFEPDGKSVHTTIDALELNIDPIASNANAGNVRIRLALNEINHDLIRLKQSSLGLAVNSSSPFDSIYDFKFDASEIAVAAGYSLGDWKTLIPKKRREHKQAEPLKLPYAHIDDLKILVLVKGLIGVKNTVFRVPPFDGEESTTIKDIASYYNDRVIAQVPGMIGNTEVLGTNIGDSVVSHYGGALLANTVGSAGFGGVLSVAAFDGVKNTIKAGKVSRGMESTDPWELSDLARGLKYSAIVAAREGAAKRGKGEGEQSDVLDWTIGATSGMAEYTVANKARLGGAGAGAVGFATGFALGGPVVAIAGAIVASAATQKSIEKIDEALKSDSLEKQKEATDQLIKDLNPRATSKGVLFQGFLLKRRDFIKWDWRPHCFVLTEEGELKYYDLSVNPPNGKKNTSGALYMDSSKEPHKCLKFVNHRVKIADSLSNPSDNLFVFTIHSSEQNEALWVLGAPSEQLRSAWVSQLSASMSRTSNEMYLDSFGDGKDRKDAPL